MQKKIEARTRKARRRVVTRNVTRERAATIKHASDIAMIGESVTEIVTEIEEVTVTGIVTANGRERRRVTANQRVTEVATLSQQRKNERTRIKLKEARMTQMGPTK